MKYNYYNFRGTTLCLLPFILSLYLFLIISVSTFSSTPHRMHSQNQQRELQGRLLSSLHESDVVCPNKNESDQRPLLTFGVLADIQYAPVPDGFSYNGTPRYYRHALQAAKHAAKHFEEEKVDFVVNLGDIIDGKCQEIEKWCKHEIEIDSKRQKVTSDESSTIQSDDNEKKNIDPGHCAIDEVLEALSAYKHGPILHTYGNHELYNLSRDDIQEKLGIPFVRESCGDLVGYYQYKSAKCSQLRFVVIDSYDISIMQRCPKNSKKHRKAVDILTANNPNYPEAENSPAGLIEKRFVGFNGAVDEPQKIWLKKTLQEAKDCGEKVIILSHQPIMPNSAGDVCLIWNYSDIVDLLRQYKCTVAAAFAGHAHKGGYQRDESGIHFRVIEAVLESKDPTKTYAIVDYYRDRLVLRGYGDVNGATYHFEHLHSNSKDNGKILT